MDEEEDSDSDEEPLKGGDVESGSTAHKKHRKAYSSMPVHPPPPPPFCAGARACMRPTSLVSESLKCKVFIDVRASGHHMHLCHSHPSAKLNGVLSS